LSKEGSDLKDDMKREELRGLFTLGLMAVLITLRLNLKPEYTLQIWEFRGIPFVSIMDIILTTWGLYAFFMVFSYSPDIFSIKTCKKFKALGQLCLQLSVALITIMGIGIALTNPIPSLYILGLLIVVFIFSKIYKRVKKG